MIGCLRNMQRFFEPVSGRCVLLALDHGVGEGMMPNASPLPELLKLAQEKRIQGVLLNKGMARAYGERIGPGTGLVVQLSAGTRHGLPPYSKSVVCAVPEALRLGADAVSLHINIGNDLEDRMLADLGLAIDEAHQLGLPVLALIGARGGQIVNERDPSLIAHCIRLGAELGADIIGVPYSGQPDSFTAAVASSPSPVLVTGGPSADTASFLNTMRQALEAGASGVCIGRNITQSPRPAKALTELLALVHGEGRTESPAMKK